MRILHVAASLSPEWGGPVRGIAGLTQGLEARGVQCTVFAARGRLVGTDCLSLAGVETHLFPTSSLARIWTACAPGLSRALHQIVADYDLIHMHAIWHFPHYAAYRAARAAGKPYCVSAYGNLNSWALSQKKLKKWLYMAVAQRPILQRAAALQATTEVEKQQIQSKGFTSPVAVIPSGITPESVGPLPSRDQFLKCYPNLSKRQIILFLGRIHPVKGLDILASAFGRIAQTRDDVCLVIAGPDNDGYRAQVEMMLREIGALDKRIFTGMLTGQDKPASLTRSL